ncbi:MAG: electron transport complex subunit RsxC [Firmicutes bacterium]|nr:electron transport complex subunit RsxC [Bacillota bacterium]
MLTFKRGVHPPDGKSLSADKPVEMINPKEGDLLYFPMSQHIGAPCTPVVAKGDRVLVGQKLGEAGGFVSSPIFSSVSGTVKELKPVLVPGGDMVMAVVVENDGKMELAEGLNVRRDYENMSNEEICNIIKEAGVVGLGGAGFPTHVKLAPPADKNIDYIIVNAAECEPYLTCDYRIMLEEPQRIVDGLKVVLKLHPNAKGVIGIEDNKPEAIKKMQEVCKDEPRIEVASLKTKFPQGAEKQLIYSITKREVPSGGLPADVGCIVDNADTIVAIERAVLRGRPLMRRIVTVSGGAAANPGNYKVRLGITFQDLMDAIGGFKEPPMKLIAGGPMMGPAMYSLDAVITKTSSALLCFNEKEAKLPPERNCIRCGKCVGHCPMGLMPNELNLNAITEDHEAFLANHGMDCIECGSCSFECPAKRQLAQSIRAEKKVQMALKNKK